MSQIIINKLCINQKFLFRKLQKMWIIQYIYIIQKMFFYTTMLHWHDSCQILHKYTLSLYIKLLYQYQNSFTTTSQDSTHQFFIEILLICPLFVTLIQLTHLQHTSHTIHPSNSPPSIYIIKLSVLFPKPTIHTFPKYICRHKTPAPQYQPIDRKKRKGKIVEDYNRDRAASIPALETSQFHTIKYMVSKIIPRTPRGE